MVARWLPDAAVREAVGGRRCGACPPGARRRAGALRPAAAPGHARCWRVAASGLAGRFGCARGGEATLRRLRASLFDRRYNTEKNKSKSFAGGGSLDRLLLASHSHLLALARASVRLCVLTWGRAESGERVSRWGARGTHRAHAAAAPGRQRGATQGALTPHRQPSTVAAATVARDVLQALDGEQVEAALRAAAADEACASVASHSCSATQHRDWRARPGARTRSPSTWYLDTSSRSTVSSSSDSSRVRLFSIFCAFPAAWCPAASHLPAVKQHSDCRRSSRTDSVRIALAVVGPMP